MEEALDLSFDRLLMMMMIVIEVPNVKFHLHAFSGCRAVTCGRREGRTDRQMDGLTVCYHLSRRERFYGDLMSPVKTQPWLRRSSCVVPNIFFPVLIRCGFFSRQIFVKSPHFQISRKSVQWEPL